MAWDPKWHRHVTGAAGDGDGWRCWLPEELSDRVLELAERWERHPADVVALLLTRMVDRAEIEPVCQGCGCSHFDPCVGDDDGEHDLTCEWVDSDWCSHCEARSPRPKAPAKPRKRGRK